jgi:type VI secretion system protein ImpB
VRPPAVCITYDAEIEPLAETVELPFVMGVLADFAGQPDPAPPELRSRRFVQADRANLDALVAACAPV